MQLIPILGLAAVAFSLTDGSVAAQSASRAPGQAHQTLASGEAQAGTSAPEPGRSAAEFIGRAGRANLAEVSVSQLAGETADGEKVREYANTVAETFADAQRRLIATAEPLGIEVPLQMGVQGEQMLKRFADEDLVGLDLAYVTQRVTQQEKLLQIYRQEAEKGETAPLRAFAGETLPRIERLLEQARVLQGELAGQRKGFER